MLTETLTEYGIYLLVLMAAILYIKSRYPNIYHRFVPDKVSRLKKEVERLEKQKEELNTRRIVLKLREEVSNLEKELTKK